MAWNGKARQGKAWLGEARQGKVLSCSPIHVFLWLGKQGLAWRG